MAAPTSSTANPQTSTAYGVGFADSYHRHEEPNAVKWEYTRLFDFHEYLRGYNEGNRRRGLAPVTDPSVLEQWMGRGVSRPGNAVNICSNCKHEMVNEREDGGSICDIEGCVCNCAGRRVLLDGDVPRPLDTADMVNHPAHHTDGKIEVWDFILDKKLDYLLGNVVKYVSRAGKKNRDKTLEDLQKARAYLDKKIEEVEAENDS